MATGAISGDARARTERPRRRWVWWLLPLLLALSALAARWGYQHIEKQVQAAAPEMLSSAGIDPQGLTFDARYRDVTVAGNLPQGVTASQVRDILEHRRGGNGADIRHARVVAAEWVSREPKPADNVTVNPVVATERDTKRVDKAAEAGPSPRVNVLLGDGQLTLSGSDVDKDQIQHLLVAATAAVGAQNVVQQWQSTELPGQTQVVQDNEASSNDERIAKVQPLATLISALGDQATAARVTLEDNIVRGSIEAVSEQSLQQLKPLAGEAVVVTAAVAVQQTQDAQPVSDPAPASTTQTINTDDATGTSSGTDDVKVVDDENPPVKEDTLTSADDTAKPVAENKQSVDKSEGEAAQSEEDELQAEIAALQAEIDALQREIDKPVFFVHDSSAITREGMPLLDNVAAAMQRYQRPGVLIDGHTDSLASRQYNLRLSKQRAASVVRYLTQNGVDANRLRSEGYGEDRPVASNKTKPGRRLNRRVEFTARRPFSDSDQ